MTRAFLASLLLLAACGGSSSKPTLGSRAGGGAPRGPVMVFIGISDGAMFEAACHECDGLRAALAGSKVSSGDATFEITGTVSDECDASGPTDVVGVERLTGDPDSTPLDIAVLPAGAPIDLVAYAGVQEHAPGADGPVRQALARLANADLKANGFAVGADDFVIEQIIEVNVAGDSRPERLIAANVPLPDEEGPGYRWSALVMAPGGDLDAATTLWKSDLEHLVIDASFDLEGDGARELVYSAGYYEGSGRGAASITGGNLDFLGTWGCGA